MAFTAPPTLQEEVRRRYAEPHRRYHDLRHLDAVLSNVERILVHSPTGSVPPEAAEAARLAALFHDAVYVVGAADNEEQSAVLAEESLTATGAPAPLAEEVGRLVRLTRHHDPSAPGAGPAAGCADQAAVVQADPAGALLCDADLAVLGGTATEYARYRWAVRAEWSALSDDAFVRGRHEVVRRLAARPWLFLMPWSVQQWEERARLNLATELPPPPP